MGRAPKPPTPKWDTKRRHWRLRFTHDGTRFDYRSTTIAKGDTKSATIWAAERTQFVLSGKWKEQVVEGTDPRASLADVAAVYLAESTGGLITDRTARLRKLHLKSHLVPFFPTLASITKSSLASYQAERLKVVQFATVKKELSCLAQVLKFAEARGWIVELPPMPKRPGKSLGTKHAHAPSGYTEGFTEELARRVLPHLPRLSRLHRASGRRWPCRLFFELLLETGLRPGTLIGIRIGKHWSTGRDQLLVSSDIDKNRWERPVPLTPRAVAILEELSKDADSAGRIFIARDHRHALKAAAKKAGLPDEMVAGIHPYDFRHARATELANTGKVLGTAYLLGHKQMTTTNRYSHANKHQATELVEQVSGAPAAPETGADSGADSGADTKAGSGGACSPLPNPLFFSCAKERTRTSTGVTPLAPQECRIEQETAFSREFQRTGAHPSAAKRKNSGATPHNRTAGRLLTGAREILARVAFEMGVLDQPCGVSL